MSPIGIAVVGSGLFVQDAHLPSLIALADDYRVVAVCSRTLEGAELSEYLTLATRVWTGETYWLLAPYKLRDPGAILTYEGEETEGGVVRDQSGLPAGDQRVVGQWRFRCVGSIGMRRFMRQSTVMRTGVMFNPLLSGRIG